MSDELTRKILKSLEGFLDITVTHPQIAGRLIVKGATNCPLDFGWEEMPPEMRVDRPVYCCRPAWDEAAPVVFVFMDEVEVVDAPADMVVDKLLDMLAEVGAYGAVDRLEFGEADGSTDVDEDPNGDWNDTSSEAE
jgi:hypothetical protein